MFKRRGLILIALSLVMGFGAAYTANRWVAAQVVGAEEDSGTHVVVAAMDIPYGTKVESRHLKYVEMPSDAVPSGVFTSKEEVQGTVSTVAIARGEILIRERFAAHETGSTLAALVAENMRALTVRVNDVVGVAGFLLPGNRVDILASKRSGRGTANTYTVLKNINVLAVDQTASTDKNDPVIVRAVTLEMTPEQTETLVSAQQEGAIQLTLRNPNEEEVIAPEPEIEEAPVVAVRRPVRRAPAVSRVTIIKGTRVQTEKPKN